MKTSDLLIKKTEISNDLLVIRNLATTEDRVLNQDEITKVEELSRSLEQVEASIKLAEKEDELLRSINTKLQKPVETKVKTDLELVRKLINNQGIQTEEHLNINREVAKGVDTMGIFVSRAGFTYGTEGDDMSPKKVAGMTVTESDASAALWQKMGLTVYPSLTGGTQKLPFMSAILGQEVAEGIAITQTAAATNHVELTPKRIGVQIAVSREGIGTYNQATWDGVMKNVYKAIDRKITAKVYAAAFAGATTVAAGAFTKVGFDALEAAVPVDGAYLMSRKSFFTAKAVAIDAGSGKFLVNRVSQDYGETYEGSPVFHSGLFADAANTKYVVYGAMSNIALGFWGNDAYEIIVDPITQALKGDILITVSRLADIKIPDAAIAFSKSPDLDPAV